MPQILTSYTPPKTTRGPDSAHDWDKLFNGKIWQLTQGEDFSCELDSMSSLIRKNARTRGVNIKVYTDPDSLTVTIVPQ